MASAAPNRVYEDFDPPSDLVSEEAHDTLLVYLPGYKKEQLRVQLTPSRLLKLSGERPTGDNKWRRFQKEFRVPSNCDTRGISAKFEGGILYIRQPKVITPATTAQPQPEDKGKAALEPPKPQPSQPRPQPQPQPEKVQAPPKPSKEEERETKQETMARKNEIPQAPEPQPQPKREAPPSDLPKDAEKEKKRQRKEDAERKETIIEVIKKRPRQVVYGSGLFRELRKPENMNKLVVSTVLVLAIGFYASYIFKSFTGNEQQNRLGYDQVEL